MKLSDISKMVSTIIENVAESVVTISTVVPRFNMFFEIEAVKGIGSGFVISSNGLLVTNAHVVKGASEVNVFFSNGVKDYAKIVALDPYRELALLKVRKEGLKPLKLGNSDNVRIGEIVFAIGSPLGLPGPTVTMGVVSAIGRTITGRNIILEDLIQTDAAINPGNSGGPLINAEGEAIGVTTAIIPYAQGVGFAIPINTVKKFIELISKYGRPIRAWIGVYVAQITPELITTYNLPVKKGLIIIRVIPRSSAYYHGLDEGDIIVKANGKQMRKVKDLKEEIENSIDKGYVTLEVLKDGRKAVLEVPIMIEHL